MESTVASPAPEATVASRPSPEPPQIDPFDVLPRNDPPEPFTPEMPPEPDEVPLPVAGWYTDPSGVLDRQRYWDGSEWTQRTRMGVPAFADAPPRGWEWKWLLFSFQGRAHRAHLWAGFGALYGSALVVILLAGSLASGNASAEETVGIGILFAFVPFVWVGLAISVKRWHDRNKSGAWVLVGLIPYIGILWWLIELGMLEGTRGPNQYGSDPRGQGVTHQAA